MHAIGVNFAQSLRAKLAELLHTYRGAPCRALLDYHLLADQSCVYVFMDMHGRGTAHALSAQSCLLILLLLIVLLGGHCLQAYVGKSIRGHLAALQLVHLVQELLW